MTKFPDIAGQFTLSTTASTAVYAYGKADVAGWLSVVEGEAEMIFRDRYVSN